MNHVRAKLEILTLSCTYLPLDCIILHVVAASISLLIVSSDKDKPVLYNVVYKTVQNKWPQLWAMMSWPHCCTQLPLLETLSFAMAFSDTKYEWFGRAGKWFLLHCCLSIQLCAPPFWISSTGVYVSYLKNESYEWLLSHSGVYRGTILSYSCMRVDMKSWVGSIRKVRVMWHCLHVRRMEGIQVTALIKESIWFHIFEGPS